MLIWSRIKLWVAAVVAVVAATAAGIAAIYAKGRKSADGAYVRRRVEAMKKAKDVRDDVESDPYFVDRARQYWVRKDD